MPLIAQLSDLHFGGENRVAVDAVAPLLAERGVDLTVLAGDLTVKGTEGEFRLAADWVAGLPSPRIITPGNHDSPYDPASRLFAPFAGFQRQFGQVDGAVFRAPWATVAAMNTARGIQIRANWSKGAVAPRQVERTIAAFAERPPEALAIVVCHHPLVEMIGGPMTAKVHGGARAARRLAEAGVDLVLTGHIHAPFALPLPGGACAYAVGSSTLSVRERGVPPGFNLIETSADTLTVTALAWTGSHFETWRQWALPRRCEAIA